MENRKLTRRQLAAAVASAPAARLAAQATPPADLNKQAHEQVRRRAGQLAKHQVPMATEPAFHFKA